jgi:hypothetical protein
LASASSEPLIRIEVIGGDPIAYRGFKELGPVHVLRSGL